MIDIVWFASGGINSSSPSLPFAALSGCRVLLERYATAFQKAHIMPKQKDCHDDLNNASVTAILTHVETCCGTTKELLEAKTIWRQGKPPSNSSESILWKQLFEALHLYLYKGPGNIMYIPDSLEPFERRWLVRYFDNKGVA